MRVAQKWTPVLRERHAKKQRSKARLVNPVKRDVLEGHPDGERVALA